MLGCCNASISTTVLALVCVSYRIRRVQAIHNNEGAHGWLIHQRHSMLPPPTYFLFARLFNCSSNECNEDGVGAILCV